MQPRMDYFKEMYRKAMRFRVLRAAGSGAAGVLVQTLVFEVAGIWLGLVRPSTAVIIGAEFGIITNFLIANRYVFGDAPAGKWLTRLVRFHLVIAVSLCIQWLCVRMAELVTHDIFVIHAAYIAGILIGFAFNYMGYKLWVWKHADANASSGTQ